VSASLGRNVEGQLALEWARVDGRAFLGLVVPGWMAYVLVGRPRP
jgi:hypothetical protein